MTKFTTNENGRKFVDVKHGGRREGAGRKPSPYTKKSVALAFANDDEYKRFMKLSPRQRVEFALASHASSQARS